MAAFLFGAPVKRVYNSTNASEAYLLRDLLMQSGIAAHVLNTHAMSAFGELPMGAAYPQVWITRPELEARALKLIADYLNRPAAMEKTCLTCAEKNPGEFDFCWSCQAAFRVEAQ